MLGWIKAAVEAPECRTGLGAEAEGAPNKAGADCTSMLIEHFF